MKLQAAGFWLLLGFLACASLASASVAKFCFGCNYAGAALAGSDFSEAVNFHNADLRNAAFDGATFAKARMVAANFSGFASSVDFSESSLGGRDLSGVALIATKFAKADLRGTNFAGANFASVQLCDDPLARSGCTNVTAAALRKNSGSDLDGAALPTP
jgi:uncharacterized protein YjbI with pentapeptide repeats